MDERHYEMAQERIENTISDRVAAITAKPARESAHHCQDCDVKIPELRRQAVPGVQRCAPCQELAELKQKHFR